MLCSVLLSPARGHICPQDHACFSLHSLRSSQHHPQQMGTYFWSLLQKPSWKWGLRPHLFKFRTFKLEDKVDLQVLWAGSSPAGVSSPAGKLSEDTHHTPLFTVHLSTCLLWSREYPISSTEACSCTPLTSIAGIYPLGSCSSMFLHSETKTVSSRIQTHLMFSSRQTVDLSE